MGVIDSDSKEILVKRIEIYIGLEDYVKAENSAIQLKMLAPSEFRSYQIYFQVLMAVEKYDQAEALLEEAEKYSDMNTNVLNVVDMYINKAMIHMVKAEADAENASTHYDTAIAILDECLDKQDIPYEAMLKTVIYKAEIYLKMSNYDEALACVDRLSVEQVKDSTGETEEELSASNDIVEQLDFIKLTCYLGKEDFETAAILTGSLKLSENEQYSYFATYADAYIAQKLAVQDPTQKEIAEEKYNIAIAFFKHKAFENPLDLFSIIFRTRLYAENAKYIKAEELIKLLPDALKEDLRTYVSDCRSELKEGE